MGADLDAYFLRIGHGGARTPTLETLAAIHRLHPAAIPFENLDPLLGRAVRLDLASLEAKLVHGRRGGYCFEQNGLLLQVLTGLGYSVTPLAARVRWMLADDAPPTALSHMLLRVDLAEGPFLVDAGFGGQSLTAPLRMQAGPEQPTPHGVYRLAEADGGVDLQFRLSDRWATLYRFTQEPRVVMDYEVSNWFTSTHPASRFVNNLIAARVEGERRLSLFNAELTVFEADGAAERRVLDGPDEAHAVLTRRFGLAAELHDLEGVWARLPPPGRGPV